LPALNRKAWVGMLNSGFVARLCGDGEVLEILAGEDDAGFLFFETRFMKLRMYSIAVRFVRNRYSSSMLAAVLPSVAAYPNIEGQLPLYSRAFFTFLLACRSPFTPNTTKRPGCLIGHDR
jgi:hypothetical protein